MTTKIAYQEAKQILDNEGPEALYNPHIATGLECKCSNCFCCTAVKVFYRNVPYKQRFLASQGIFSDIESIEVVGRRWTDSNCNTYHKSEIVLKGKDFVKSYKTKYSYGGEIQYEESAYEYLFVDHFNDHENRDYSLPRLLRRLDIEFKTTAINVKRKKDM